MFGRGGPKIQEVGGVNETGPAPPLHGGGIGGFITLCAIYQIGGAGRGRVGSELIAINGIVRGQRRAVRPNDIRPQAERHHHLIHLDRACAVIRNNAIVPAASGGMHFCAGCKGYEIPLGIHHLIAGFDREFGKLCIAVGKRGQLSQDDRLIDIIHIIDRAVVHGGQHASPGRVRQAERVERVRFLTEAHRQYAWRRRGSGSRRQGGCRHGSRLGRYDRKSASRGRQRERPKDHQTFTKLHGTVPSLQSSAPIIQSRIPLRADVL